MKMTFKTAVIGGVIVFFAVVTVAVFLPALIWNPPETVIAHTYDREQERGRKLFYSNGCNYCHTQYVREEDTAMGPLSQGGNYVYDNPMTLGSERTGPDLSYVGRKRSMTWEIEHLKAPRTLSPLSIMPNWDFLPDDDLHAIATYLFSLGDRVAQERMILPPDAYAGRTSPIPYQEVTPGSGDEPQGWPTWQAAGLQEGKELYTTHCLTCHGCAGNGLGSYGGTLAVTPADYKQDPFRNMPDDQWLWHVSEGVPGTVMPTWKTSLTEDQRWKAIRYIQQVFARPAMHDPDEGDPVGEYAGLANPLPISVSVLEHGKAIYTRECLVCHGDAGHGGGLYAKGIQPTPADFSDSASYGTLENPIYTDADFFWRISEGVPWTAMPAWKLQYSEEDRWALSEYIAVNFMQIRARPVQNELLISPPKVYLDQIMPDGAAFERGQITYLTSCAQCHGLSGQGDGWNGTYLDVTPIPFADLQMEDVTDGQWLVKTTFGVPNTAMPAYGEFLPESQRWDAIKYIKEAFVTGRPTSASVYDPSKIAVDLLLLSRDNWVGEGYVISTTHGADLYSVYCATCHGTTGQGDGPGTSALHSGGAAPFPQDMAENYIYWRVRDGVPASTMFPFGWYLSENDVWDVTSYVKDLTSSNQGGKP
jgi:mono/diheme cytochrome c family protein